MPLEAIAPKFQALVGQGRGCEPDSLNIPLHHWLGQQTPVVKSDPVPGLPKVPYAEHGSFKGR